MADFCLAHLSRRVGNQVRCRECPTHTPSEGGYFWPEDFAHFPCKGLSLLNLFLSHVEVGPYRGQQGPFGMRCVAQNVPRLYQTSGLKSCTRFPSKGL